MVFLYFLSFIVRQQKKFQSNPESYNGAVRDNYSWSQSISDVDVRVMVLYTFFNLYNLLNIISLILVKR